LIKDTMLKIVGFVALPLITATFGGTAIAAPASAGGWSQCGVHCAQFEVDDGNVQSFEIHPAKGRPLATASVTDAADLPFGMTWQIDGGKQLRIPFMHCGRGTCIDQVIINDQYLNALRGGSTLRLGTHQGSSWKVSAIRLAGFGSAYYGK
jgi:invasion protein IalB